MTKVLVTGGSGLLYGGLDSAELYDPVTGGWTVTGSMLARKSQVNTNLFGSNVDAYSAAAQGAFESARNMFIVVSPCSWNKRA